MARCRHAERKTLFWCMVDGGLVREEDDEEDDEVDESLVLGMLYSK